MMTAPRLAFENVAVTFPSGAGEIAAVEDVSFGIGDGEFVALIGPSGCGKSTLLNCAAGFLAPTRGHVLLDGRLVAGPGPDRGVIFQEYGVFPWLTVAGNIEFGLTLRAQRALVGERAEIRERYLRLMGLEAFRDAYPKTLSGGMRQRLALARAYTVRPEFLLMDEPFGALDAQTRTAMQDLLLQVLHAEGKTVMLITHSVEEALYLSSRVVVVTARPARVRVVVEVPFPYPRTRAIQGTPEFIALLASLRSAVMDEYAAQERQRGEPAG
jgi:NitT/TauT family transport system ATP-binding protein